MPLGRCRRLSVCINRALRRLPQRVIDTSHAGAHAALQRAPRRLGYAFTHSHRSGASKSSACATHLDDRRCAGGRLHAFVELQDSSASSAAVSQDLARHCRERLISAALPSCMLIVAQLPRSSAGKLQRGRLRELLPDPQGPAASFEAPSIGTLMVHRFQPEIEKAATACGQRLSAPPEAATDAFAETASASTAKRHQACMPLSAAALEAGYLKTAASAEAVSGSFLSAHRVPKAFASARADEPLAAAMSAEAALAGTSRHGAPQPATQAALAAKADGRGSDTPTLRAPADLRRQSLSAASEADVMRAFLAALGGQAAGFEPVSDFWACGGDSRAAMQVVALLGVDVRMLTAFPTARGLARHMQQAAGRQPGASAAAGQKRSRFGEGTSASGRSLLHVKEAHSYAKRAKRPPLWRLPSRYAAVGTNSPEAKESHVEVGAKSAENCRQQSQASSAEHAQQALQPPDPSLGGVAIQRCGLLSFHRASASPDHISITKASRPCQGSDDSHQQAAQEYPSEAVSSRVVHRVGESVQPVCQQAGESRIDGHSAGQQEASTRPRKLALQWRVKLRDCVDAAPQILLQRQLLEGALTTRWYAFGCSHGGDIVCLDGETGAKIWGTSVSGRAESGLVLSADLKYVVVALLGGDMLFLSSVTGQIRCSASCVGELKAAPAVDPWDGRIWIASHGCQLSICTSSGEMTSGLEIPADQGLLVIAGLTLQREHVCRQDVSEPVSTPVVFDTRCRQAYVASLQGTVAAFAFTPSCSTVSQVWTSAAEGPVLSAPAYLHLARGLGVASAHGVVQCFGSKRGEQLWRVELGSAVFSPIASFQPPVQPSQILLGTQTGQLLSLHAVTGHERWRKHLVSDHDGEAQNSMGISTAAAPAVSSERAWEGFDEASSELGNSRGQFHCRPVATDGCQGESGVSIRPQLHDELGENTGPRYDLSVPGTEAFLKRLLRDSESRFWSCTNDGDLILTDCEGDGQRLVAEAHLGCQIFSSPVAFDDIVLFGCRDDHLYCVKLEQLIQVGVPEHVAGYSTISA